MFRVKQNSGYFQISDKNGKHLHSDGSILKTIEYWPTREQAQAVLDKYQPAHVWEHGDVFEEKRGTTMIYLVIDATPYVYCCPGPCWGAHDNSVSSYLQNATFLFNIKEKL